MTSPDTLPDTPSDDSSRRLKIAIAIGLLVIGVALRGAFLVATRGHEPDFEGDEGGYHWIAVSGVEGTGWKTLDGYQSYRPPLLPGLLAGLYSMAGTDPQVGRWLLVVVGSLTAPLIFLAAPGWFGISGSSALLIALVWMLYPTSIFYSARILTENLAVLLVLLSAGLYIRAARSGTLAAAVITGVAWGFLALTRPNFLFLPFGIVAFSLVAKRWLGSGVLQPKQMAAAFVVFVVVLAPWTIRNYRIHDAFIPTTTLGGLLIPKCNYKLEDPKLQAGGYRWLPEIRAIYDLPEREWNSAGMSMTREYLADHWPLLFRPVLNRAKNFWTFRPNPYKESFTSNDVLMGAIWLPVLAFFLLSLVRCSWRDSWLSLLIIAYAFFMTLPFWGTPRFRYPVEALIFIQAGIAWDSVARDIKWPPVASLLENLDRRLGPASSSNVAAG